MKITLTQGFSALIDEDDFENVKGIRWYYSHGYAQTTLKGKKVYMHRMILSANAGQLVDHINQDTLDNRKVNLRFTTKQMNALNSSKKRLGRSRFRGVSWHKQNRRWRAYININNKQKSLGLYDREEDAATAYNEKVRSIYGDLPCLNKI